MDLMTDKKKYIKPITESFPMIEEDFIANTTENHKEYIDDEQDDWGGDDVIIDPDPDEEIDW